MADLDKQEKRYAKIEVYSRSPFENSFADVIQFKDRAEQLDFFETSSLLTSIYKADDYSQIMKTGEIYISGRVENYESASYMRFQNEGGRWFFAFILDTVYEKEDTTRIIFEIDVWQTYQFDLQAGAVTGQVEQATLKRKTADGLFNIRNTMQGFNVGDTVPSLQDIHALPIDWLVVVAKTTIKLSDGAQDITAGFPSTFKSFKYFVVPVNLKTGRTRKFTYDGNTYEPVQISRVVDEISNKYEDDQDTVNQIINMYTQKYVGIEYTETDGTINIQSIPSGKVHVFGEPVNGTDPTKPNPGTNTGEISWTGDLINGSYTLKEADVIELIRVCRQFQILPSHCVSQLFLESFWGNTPVGQQDNNWGGFTFPGTGNPELAGKVTQGQARPANEGGYYCHYQSAGDFFKDYGYLLSDGVPYKVAGQTDLQSSAQGLFRAYGAQYDYAASGADHYVPLMLSVWQDIVNANGARAQELVEQVYKDGKWITGTITGDSAGLEHMRGLIGQLWGNGECYAVPAEYSGFLGGVGLGAGTQYGISDVVPGGDTINACNIGYAYNWAKYGWQVISRPTSVSQAQAGDIINWASYGGAGLGVWGHTGVIESIEGNTLHTIEQNNPIGSPISRKTIDFNTWTIETLVRPQGQGAVKKQGMGAVVTLPAVLEIQQMYTTKPLEEPTTFNFIESAFGNIADRIGMGTEYTEPQLLHGEFSYLRMFDGLGNTYNYHFQFMEQTGGKNHVMIHGAVGDSNHIHYTLAEYKQQYKELRWENFNHGIMDNSPRSITIQSDNSATFMQQNKNQYDAQQSTFKENKGLLDKQISLSNRQVGLANEQATYNANFAVTSSQIGFAQSGINTGFGVIGNLLGGNILGAVQSGINGGFNMLNSYRGMENAQEQAGFTERNNSMRSESNSLSNMSAKNALNQSIRSYNASIKDIASQPISIQQIGADLSFQHANSLDNLFFSIELPTAEILKQANDYLRGYGVIVNEYSSDVLREYGSNRRDFNYIKLNQMTFKGLNINQSHFNALRSIFITGTRVWRYNNEGNDFTFKFLNNGIENPDM